MAISILAKIFPRDGVVGEFDACVGIDVHEGWWGLGIIMRSLVALRCSPRFHFFRSWMMKTSAKTMAPKASVTKNAICAPVIFLPPCLLEQ